MRLVKPGQRVYFVVTSTEAITAIAWDTLIVGGGSSHTDVTSFPALTILSGSTHGLTTSVVVCHFVASSGWALGSTLLAVFNVTTESGTYKIVPLLAEQIQRDALGIPVNVVDWVNGELSHGVLEVGGEGRVLPAVSVIYGGPIPLRDAYVPDGEDEGLLPVHVVSGLTSISTALTNLGAAVAAIPTNSLTPASVPPSGFFANAPSGAGSGGGLTTQQAAQLALVPAVKAKTDLIQPGRVVASAMVDIEGTWRLVQGDTYTAAIGRAIKFDVVNYTGDALDGGEVARLAFIGTPYVGREDVEAALEVSGTVEEVSPSALRLTFDVPSLTLSPGDYSLQALALTAGGAVITERIGKASVARRIVQ